MTDYSTAATNASDALEDVAEGLIEEYEIRSNGRRVKRGRVIDQIKAAALLDGLASRQSHGLFRLARFKDPR
jgi:hypothetical protein